MTRHQQFELTKKLRELGCRGRIEQSGRAWRIIVSQIPLVQKPTNYKWSRDTKGNFVKEELPPEFYDRPTSTAATASRLLCLFKENGWPHARVIRIGSSDIQFELDHKYNIWKTLQNL